MSRLELFGRERKGREGRGGKGSWGTMACGRVVIGSSGMIEIVKGVPVGVFNDIKYCETAVQV